LNLVRDGLGIASKSGEMLPFFRIFFACSLVGICFAPLSTHAQQVLQVNSASAVQLALDGIADGGIIELAGGTYAAPPGGWTIFPDLNGGSRSFTVRAAPGATVVLTGNGANRILTVTTPKPVTFERLRFANGFSTEEFHAGAVSIAHVQASFVACAFEDNVANPPVTGGGAVWIDTSTVLFDGCVFNNNTSKNYAGAFSSYDSRVYVRGCRFAGNRTNLPGHSAFSAAGAIHGNAGSIHIANSRFEDNQAGYVGGAIYVLGTWDKPPFELEITDSLFTGNVAVRDPGGTKTDPTTGGAIFMEDKVNGHFYNSRFTNNVAQQGGAISSFRSNTDIKDCVFQANRAVGSSGNGESLGGAIIVLSPDNPDQTTDGGTINRPPAQVTVTDSLIQGEGPGTPSARQGGGIFISGDTHAAFGITVQQNGTQASNRTLATLKRVVFADLASTDDAGNGTGGAVTAVFTTLLADSCIVERCSASQYGGGFEFAYGSDVTITKSTFSKNTAGVWGAAITMIGGAINIDGCNMFDNQMAGLGGGSAFAATSQPAAGGFPDWEVIGLIQNCVISNNPGGLATIYDGQRDNGPANRLQYNANQFYPADSSAFLLDGIGSRSVGEINGLTLTLSDGSQVKKALVANVALPSPKAVGAILEVPQMARSSGAPGESLPVPAYLGYAASVATPFLDGAAQSNPAGIAPTSANGVHTLTFGTGSSTTAAPPGVALNISTRLPVGTGQQVLIGGFIIQGPNPKTIMLRASGPSLPLPGVLQDPFLELHDGTGQTIATNDNWRSTNLGGLLTSSQMIDIVASTIPPANDAESAIIATLNPGTYTAVVRGANNETGIGVVEGYDLDADSLSTLANISTRGYVLDGDNVMIGGFIFGGGPGATKVVLRGIGPSLAAFGVANPLMDPTLELHNGNGATVDSNDDWTSNQARIAATGLQPSNNLESAMVETNLLPGAYTAILRGKNNQPGVGVLEVYIF
jgi:parallel beta helix pectate lyase-like protein